MPYMLNGELLEIEGEPRLQDGTLWVPLRKLGGALGGKADWISENRVAALYLNDHVATLTIGDNTADVDGEQFELQAAPFVESGETWVPVRLFERGLGYTLSADPQSGIVDLGMSA
ncbi:Copper amine oxidase N-terminal domain-containing protein [Abditibacterium utsteinense]|uniref:Copper amine oxidase N-terminal domain-containing protein n=1 Tax=Abditibacterium utsteinense TaxID=1960156 RepID=A0A2S8SXI3_9BACT|nr:copper amine oxidase N-terminal domain-containing protein [Abditibacterium utsteinense]PQV65459.1 Copper amine oxidase N-terminal domain-containing protein [Abditibacterium utsteinense]